MSYRNHQAKFIRKFLKFIFPCPEPVAVCATAIRLNEKVLLVGKVPAPNLVPPKANAGDCKFWSLMRYTDDHKAFIMCGIINAIWNGYAIGIAGIIAFQDILLFFAIGASWVFEVSDQFTLLGIH